MQFTDADGHKAVIYDKLRLIAYAGRLYRTDRNVEIRRARLLATQRYQRIVAEKDDFMYGGLIYRFFSNDPAKIHTEFTLMLCVPVYVINHRCMWIDMVNYKFRRAQRWMKARAVPLVQARKLAVAMALHARLGALSPLAVLGCDGIEMVVN